MILASLRHGSFPSEIGTGGGLAREIGASGYTSDMAGGFGTYVSFHAAGTANPVLSDIKYYYLMRAWARSPRHSFDFNDSHGHLAAPKAKSRERLRMVLRKRLCQSHSFVLILTATTRLDQDWVPWEIEFAIDECDLSVICAYPGLAAIPDRESVSDLWPITLNRRIRSGEARTLHIPFRPAELQSAIGCCSAERLGNVAQGDLKM